MTVRRDSFLSLFEKLGSSVSYNKQGDCHYIPAGYPWFKCRARDLFVSLPGLTLAIDEPEFEAKWKRLRKHCVAT